MVCVFLSVLPYIMILENQHKHRDGHNEKFRKASFPKEVTVALSSKHWKILSNGFFCERE